jgi:hypothetical protein
MKSEMNTKAGLFQGQSLRSFCLKLMGVLFLTVVAPQTFWAQGITVCYDYAYWRATGSCPVGHYLGAQQLIDMQGYQSYRISNPTAGVGHLRPGDVLVTSDGHAGYVNDQGGIDHFHQVYGHSGQLYSDPNNLPGWSNGHGGLRTGDDLPGFLGSGYHPSPNQTMQVVRRRGGSTGSSGGFGCGRSGRH